MIALLLLACSGAAYAAQPFFDNSNPDLTASRLFELEYAEGVTCSRRTAQVFPDTAAGTVEGRAAYQFQNTSGQGWTVCFGVDPGYDITSARANGAEISPVRTGYEESNMALWEIASRRTARWSWCWSTAASPGTGTLRRPPRAPPRSAEPICAWRIRT